MLLKNHPNLCLNCLQTWINKSLVYLCLHTMEKYWCKEGGNHRCKITVPKDI